jgi:hypothetical protein
MSSMCGGRLSMRTRRFAIGFVAAMSFLVRQGPVKAAGSDAGGDDAVAPTDAGKSEETSAPDTGVMTPDAGVLEDVIIVDGGETMDGGSPEQPVDASGADSPEGETPGEASGGGCSASPWRHENLSRASGAMLAILVVVGARGRRRRTR